MQACDLPHGLYIERKLSNDEMWESFNWLFSKRSKNDSSYKFIFFKAIIESLDKKDSMGHISFDTLFCEFTRLSWNLVLKYGIAQKGKVRDGRVTLLEKTLKESPNSDISFYELSSSDKDKICAKIKQNCKKYVVGALYGDMKGYLYSFSKKEEWIEINPQMEAFIEDNKGIIEDLNYYKWSRFYEDINEATKKEELVQCIAKDFVRKNESIYRAILAYEFERTENEILPSRINTLEILFEADRIDDSISYEVESEEVEEELYKDISHLKTYMADPILLIKQIQKDKGLAI